MLARKDLEGNRSRMCSKKLGPEWLRIYQNGDSWKTKPVERNSTNQARCPKSRHKFDPTSNFSLPRSDRNRLNKPGSMSQISLVVAETDSTNQAREKGLLNKRGSNMELGKTKKAKRYCWSILLAG